MRYFGHIDKRQDGVERLIVEENAEGRRSRGRTPLKWTDPIKTLSGYTFTETTHDARSRE